MRSVTYIFLLLMSAAFISSSTMHEYYVGVTVIEYAEEQQSLQIINQIYIDDFEKALRERYNDTITLAEDDEPEIVDTYMSKYLAKMLKIKVNGKEVDFKFIGKEYKDDITYSYLEIENISNIKTIEVTNKALFDVISEQQNIVRLKMLGKNRSFLLVRDNDYCMLNFN